MLQTFSFADFQRLAPTAKRVVVFREIVADHLTPILCVSQLKNEMHDGVILESAVAEKNNGRYSIIAFDTFAELRSEYQCTRQRIEDEVTHSTLNPIAALRALQKELACISPYNFVGGGVGYFTYDAIRFFENIPDQHKKNNTTEFLMRFYRTTLQFDHHDKKLMISEVVTVSQNLADDYALAQQKIAFLIQKLNESSKIDSQPSTFNTPGDIKVDVEDDEFMQQVLRAKTFIQAGDVFQVVLSRQFKKSFSANPFDIFRALRMVSPSPYMFYLPYADRIIMGASPEKLVRVINGEVSIRPIAGTRKRTAEKSPAEITQELLNDPKEVAEHMMLVDLARNDLGRVCQPGSIVIDEMRQVKHFSHVSHIISDIHGQLAPDKDALDALSAAFPAGTLSGAPKIRAMEIIDSLEITRRGMYGGVICRVDFGGNLDSCIAIRMAELVNNIATVRAGAGIVHDSSPAAEAQETRLKAAAFFAALQFAEEGLL